MLKCDTQETKYPTLRLVTSSLINKTNVLWWRFSIVNISTGDFWKENSHPLSTFSFSKGIIFQHTVSAVLQRELKTAAASKSKEKIFALKTLEWALTSWYYYLFWIVIMNQFQIYSTSIHISQMRYSEELKSRKIPKCYISKRPLVWSHADQDKLISSNNRTATKMNLHRNWGRVYSVCVFE